MATGGSLIGALRVTLGLDSSQFEAGTKRARQVANRDVRAIQADLSKVRQGFDNLRNAALTTALGAAGKRALEYASSLGEVAQQAGVSAKELQEYRYAASQAGVSSDEMDKALAKLTRTIGEAKAGSKEQATVFRDLGVAIQDANGRVYSAGEIIPRLADALSRIKDPATRARYEVDLFGKAGQKLDTLLAGGSGAINELRDAAQKLGIVLSDRQIQNADETADKLAALKQVLEARIAGVVADNADSIMSLANALANLANMAAQANKSVPGLLSVLAGATIGGTFGGKVGAGVGAAAGFGSFLLDRAKNDPLGLKNETPANLVARQRKLTSQIKTSSKSGNAGSAEFGELVQMSNMIDAEIGRRMAALRAGKPAASPEAVADGALPTIKPSGGGKRKPKDRSQDYLERYERELAGLQDEQLQLQQSITTDVHERARLEHQRIETAQAAYDHDVDGRQKAGELDAAQAERLRLAYAANATREHTLANWRLDDELTQQELDLNRSRLENASELLRGELDGARTQAERRRIQLAILENEQALERASLEAVLARRDATEADKRIAQAKLDQLSAETAQRAGAIRRGTMGPMESYLDSLPRTAAELQESFENIQVDALNNGLDLASRNIIKLKGFAGDLFNQLISDTIRLNIQSSLTGGGGLLGSLGKLLGLAGSAVTATTAGSSLSGVGRGMVPKMAGGGRFNVGGIPGVDRNVLAVNGIPRAMVSANENVSVGYGGSQGGGGVVRIILDNDLLDARIVSGSVEVVRTSAPTLTQGAIAGTVAELSRRRI
jgi:hypothetical protein